MKQKFTAVVPFVVYLALSIVLYGRDYFSGQFFQPNVDSYIYIWCLNWWPFAVTHGFNPSISTFIWSPTGYPMWWANSIPSLAVILAPITLTWGATRSWNFIALVTPGLNAYACFLLIRYITKKSVQAFVGAIFFGFASYVTSAELGHLSLSLVPFVPLSVLLILKRASRDLGRWPYVAMMSVLAIFQFGLSTEVLASSVFFGLIAFLLFIRRYRESYDMSGVAKDTLIAVAVSMLVLSPALYYMVVGSKELPTVINSPQVFSADLVNVLIPNPTIWIGGEAFKWIGSKFTGNYSEQGAYIGMGLCVILVFAILKNFRQRWSQPLLVMLALTSIFSLGPVLWIAGHNTGIPLPWTIFTKAPIIRHALPTRFTVYSSLIIAIYVGMWLSSAAGRKEANIRYLAVAVSFLLLLPNPDWFKFGDVATPKVFSDTEAQRAFGKNANIVVLPYGHLGNSLLWQFESGMAFRMAGGYVGFAPQSQLTYDAVTYFYDAEAPSQDAFNKAVSVFCRANEVNAIAVAPGTSTRLATAVLNLPWKREVYGDTIVVRVPAD
ncbi:hypothetical protein [Caballeronia sp. dw_19]|uniref:hypothetical protein n=1 Tax=Caballeronia sp. dw_19 TaxID=2719791 RepID=UPI001BD36791|nr:hypothetical protein [Caballeronia sp. dw_19]